MFWCLWFSFWFGLLITTLSFTCLHSLRTPLLINGSIKISLFFLFSYSCCHLRYSFVPCKYVPCHHHTSIFLTYWFTSIQDRFCHGDKTEMLNSTSFFFPWPVMKSGFTETRGRGNVRSGPNVPTSAAMSGCTGRMWWYFRQNIWERWGNTFSTEVQSIPVYSWYITGTVTDDSYISGESWDSKKTPEV